jgi:hypothetical protein
LVICVYVAPGIVETKDPIRKKEASLDTRFRFVYNARTRTIVQLSRVIAPTRNFSGLDALAGCSLNQSTA